MAATNAVERLHLTAQPAGLPAHGNPLVPLASEVLTDLGAVAALGPDYAHLVLRTGNVLPFALHAWHLTWCAHFLNRYPGIEEQLLFHVLRKRSGECAAIVPLILRRWRTGPLRLATADLVGADAGLSEIRTPLIEPGFEGQAVAAVHRTLRTLADWDWIHWRGMDPALAASVGADTGLPAGKIIQDFLLDLPDSWPVLHAGLSRNMRESLRHCYNSLRREGHRFEFVVACTPAEVAVALEHFLRLHTLRARMRQVPSHPDHFAAAPQRDFLREVCAALCAQGVVRVFQLRIGQAIVAARIGFVVGDSLYLYYSGFDPAWARFSVMTTTVAETVRYAIAQGLKSVNLSPTPERSKLRWRPRMVEYASALVARDTLGSQAACRLYRAVSTGDNVPSRVARRLLRARWHWG